MKRCRNADFFSKDGFGPITSETYHAALNTPFVPTLEMASSWGAEVVRPREAQLLLFQQMYSLGEGSSLFGWWREPLVF